MPKGAIQAIPSKKAMLLLNIPATRNSSIDNRKSLGISMSNSGNFMAFIGHIVLAVYQNTQTTPESAE